MSTIQLRPTFVIAVDEASLEVLESIRRVVEQQDFLEGQFRKGHALVSIAMKHRHFWSPWLHLDLRKSETGPELFGRFSPHPAVWTGIMFGYLVVAVLVFFAAIIGAAQQLAGEFAWGYWIMPVGLGLGVLLWMAGQVGQRLAVNEMIAMKSMIDEAMKFSQTE